jgi:hypothetical protein
LAAANAAILSTAWGSTLGRFVGRGAGRPFARKGAMHDLMN